MDHPRLPGQRLIVTGVMAAVWVIFGLALTACLPTPPPGCDGPDAPPPEFALVAQGAPDPCDPPPPCLGCGGASGDPHITTFDQRHYDFHTAAEVVVARAPDDTFEVQWRQEQIGETNTGGVTAVAMSIDGSRVTIVGAEDQLRVDGRPMSLGGDGEAVRLASGVTIHQVDRAVVVVSADGDAAVHVIRHPSASGVLVDPPDDHMGQMQGLLGDADGNPENDPFLADGTVLVEPDWEAVHPELGEAWRVVDDITLFDYDDGKGPDDYWDPSFPERQPTIDDFTDDERAEAEAICRAAGVTDPHLLESCIFDVLVTGDPTYADLAFAQQRARDGSERGGPSPVPPTPQRSGAATPMAGTWATTYGPMIFHADGDVLVATYVALDGTLRGEVDGFVYTATWMEPSSNVECDTEVDGTRYWGRAEFTFADDLNSFEGVWGYCDGELDQSWKGTRSVPDASATDWTTVVSGMGQPRVPIVLDDLLVVQVVDDSGTGVLVGLDRDSGEEEWRLEGVDRRCGITTADGHIVAMAQADGPLAEPDGSAALIAVDADGSVRDRRYAPDDLGTPLVSHDSSLTTSGDVVLYVVARWVVALDADDLSERWRVELPARSAIEGVTGPDGRLWVAWPDGDGGVVVAMFDVDTGDLVAEVELAGRVRRPGAAVADPDGGLTIGLQTRDQGLVVRLDRNLDLDWSVELEADEFAPPDLAVAGDMVVGYTDGRLVTAFDLSDGERLWSARPTSFTNNHGEIVGDDDGNTYVASFGGAHLESYDSRGRLRWQLDPDSILVGGENPGATQFVGPLVEGVVFATSAGPSGVVVVAMPVGGG